MSFEVDGVKELAVNAGDGAPSMAVVLQDGRTVKLDVLISRTVDDCDCYLMGTVFEVDGSWYAVVNTLPAVEGWPMFCPGPTEAAARAALADAAATARALFGMPEPS